MNFYTSSAISYGKLRQLMMEAFELAFCLCNNEAEDYGIDKIVDIVQQIIPTAFVLETSYWIFFTSILDKLCVCRQCGITCKHKYYKTHWVDTLTVHKKRSFRVRRQQGIYGTPVNFTLNILPVEHRNAVDVIINLRIKSTDNIFYANRFQMSQNYVIRLRYSLKLNTNIFITCPMHFQPHPCSHSWYGSIFSELLEKFTFISTTGHVNTFPSSFLMQNYGIRYTIKPIYTDIEERPLLGDIVNLLNFCKSKNKRDRSTQVDLDGSCSDLDSASPIKRSSHQQDDYNANSVAQENIWKYETPALQNTASASSMTFERRRSSSDENSYAGKLKKRLNE